MRTHDCMTTEGITFYVCSTKNVAMARKRTVSRRTALKVTGTAAATALVAGCSSGGGGDDGSSDDGSSSSEVEVDPGQIEFEAATNAWVGLAPDSISEEENPTLVLQEGEEYEIGWTEGDDANHNIEIRDSNDEVIDEFETDEVADPGDDQWLTFDANSDMATYVCDPHEDMMVGDITVE